jgi:hypothetical protein
MPLPPRPRPSDRVSQPADVTDPLMWRLATDVAAAHQTGNDGRCSNLQCADQTGPCRAARHAHRALQLARTPQQAPVPAAVPARGRAAVPTHRGRFTGWFSPTPTPIRWTGTGYRPYWMPDAPRAAA